MKKNVIFIFGENSLLEKKAPLLRLGGLSLIERSLKLAQINGYEDISIFCSFEMKLHLEKCLNKLNVVVKSFKEVDSIVSKPMQLIVFGDYYFEYTQIAQLFIDQDYRIDFHRDSESVADLPNRNVWLNHSGSLFSKISDLQKSEAPTEVRSICIEPEMDFAFQNKQSLRLYEKSMFKGLEKASDAFTARHLNRKISIFISKYLVKTSITPNQITIFIFVLSLSIPYFLNMGTYWGFLAGAFMYQTSSVLDGCDGEIARIKLTYSKFGAWLDTVCDHLTHVMFFIGLGFGMYTRTGSYIGLVLATLILVTFCAILWLIFEEAKKSGSFGILEDGYKKSKLGKKVWWSDVADFIKPFGQRANYTMVILLMALFGVLPYVLYIGFFLAVVIFLYALCFIPKECAAPEKSI